MNSALTRSRSRARPAQRGVDDRDPGGRARQFRGRRQPRACGAERLLCAGHPPDLRAAGARRRPGAAAAAVEAAMGDPRFVAIGEIGLDFFIPLLCEPAMREKQERFSRAAAHRARLRFAGAEPVRRSQDQVLKHLRQVPPPGGIAHAFNGSEQQANTFIKLGMHLGFGGAMTFTRALQIRRLATAAPGPDRARDRRARHLSELDPPGAQQPAAAAGDRGGPGRAARHPCAGRWLQRRPPTRWRALPRFPRLAPTPAALHSV